MYEHMTFEVILQRMLDRVTTPVDKREGSVIWDALAPAAVELQLMYIELDVILRETYADTATREFLIKRAAERNIIPYPASHAILRGEFDVEVPIGSRFSLELLDYVVLERMEDGDWRVQCETAGAEGNRYLGALVPIDYIPGLTKAALTEVLIPGEDEEDTESIRKRYIDSFNPQAYGGNIRDYQDKVKELQAVGGVKVYPVWNGGGTVKLTILDSEYNPPTQELLDYLQTAIDPEQNGGEGWGIAPIGHLVTVVSVEPVETNITTRLTYTAGYNWERVQSLVEEVVEGYLLELRKEWEDSEQLVVRLSHLETRILAVQGILDIADTAINGESQNYTLGSDEVPVRGEIHDTGS